MFSNITNEERFSRNNFYKNLVWIVDGLRRKRDKDQFFKALKDGVQVIASPVLIKIYSDESRLVQEWKDSNVPVFFDFGEDERIWWLMSFKEDGWSYVVPFSRQNFIDFHLGKLNTDFATFLNKCVQDYRSLFLQLERNRQRQQVVMIPRRYPARRRSRRL